METLRHLAELFSRRYPVPLYVFILAGIALALLIIVIWSLKRRRDPKFLFDIEGGFEELLPSIVGSTHASMIDGNRVDLFENGAFFEPLKEALRSAKKSICFETFLWKPGKLSGEIVEILCERARADVAVRVLLDGSGGKISREELRQLKEADCKVAFYHPIRISNLGVLNNRDHRKIVIVDGKIGFIGGHCIVDDWLGDAQDKKHFRDLSVRVEGPIVGEMQSAMHENWVEETGEVLLGDRFFPQLGPCGDITAHLVYVSPSGSTSSIELLHYVAIHVAKKQIRVQNPYFVPDPEAIDALLKAVKRGVDVRIMLPASDASDSPIVQHASHHRFGALLKGGVRIYEYKRTLLHQKVMTVDHCWTSIGSTNFDDRSFELNDEVTLGVYNEDFAARMEEIFERDLEHCSEYTLEEWKHRGLVHRMKDFAAFLVNEQL